MRKADSKLYNILVATGLLFSACTFAQTVPLVFEVENRTPTGTCNTTAGNTNTSITSMPDPFTFTTGGRVATFDDWTCRRNQIKSDIEKYEIGTKPQKPSSITATYSGGVLKVTCTQGGQTLTLTSNVTMPSGTGPFPVVIGMNAPTGTLGANLFSGVIQIPFNHNQVTTYNGKSANDPFFKLYPTLTANGQYSAWSWGISRLIDGIELVKSQMNADTKRICVTGCSYAGKMALFGGAFDERVALTIAQESGGGGINSWRMSDIYANRVENIEKINNTDGSWFMNSMKSLNPYTLPHDHHELVAMIAPRAFLAFGNPDYGWLGDESGYKSLMAAVEVWKAMGVEDRFGFDFAGGHSHCSAAASQNTAATAFITKFLKNGTANTTIRSRPNNSKFDLTINSSVFNWTTPTITFAPANPNIPAITLTSPVDGSSLDAPATINIAATVTDADNNVTKVEFYDGTTKVGEDATAPYAFAMTNVGVGAHAITAVVTDASNNKATSSAKTVSVTTTYKIYKTNTPILVDGTIEETWNNSVVIDATLSKVLTGTIANSSDLSAKFKTLWDNTYLYILGDVNDQTLNNDSQNWYDDDAIEVYVDINNDKATTYGANDVQYTFGWNDGTSVGANPTGRSSTGLTYKMVAKTGGYIFEARIPWTTLQATPALNQLVGLDFMVNDDDNGTTRDKKISWNSATDNAYTDASLFGIAKLSDAIVTGNEDGGFNSLSSESICYPNPFNTQLTIETKGHFSYQLMNQFGEILESNQANDKTSLEKEYPKGVYLIKIMKHNQSKIIKLVKE